MVTEYDMSDRVGPVHLSRERRPVFLGERSSSGLAGSYGDAVADAIDAEVRRIVANALEEAQRLLTDNRDSLEAITQQLLEAEQLEGDELDRALAKALELHRARQREAAE
jgi:cell division protease FtsH